MKMFRHIMSMLACAALAVSFSSCDEKKEVEKEEEPAYLSVTPTQLTLLSEQNSNATFNIKANGDWTLSCSEQWLTASATSGSGDATITLTALSMNDSSTERKATVSVQSGGQEASVSVSQNPSYLSVSPTQLTLLSEQNSSATFSITASGDWTLSCSEQWLTVSATSGSKDATIILTALSKNDSSTERKATVSVRSGGQEASVSVSQLPALAAGCEVQFKNLTVMTSSVAFELEIGSNVSYFTYGWLKANAAGWTDDKIVEVIEKEAEVFNDAEGVKGLDGLNAGTTYYLIGVAYDDKGNRGELTKMKFETPITTNNDPKIIFSKVHNDSSYWYWTTNPNARTKKYYMTAFLGVDATIVYFGLTEAEIAVMFKKGISEGTLEAYANSVQPWKMKRDAGSDDTILLTAWGVDVDDEFSPVLSLGYYYLTDTKSQSQQVRVPEANKVRKTSLSQKEIDKFMKSCHLIRL